MNWSRPSPAPAPTPCACKSWSDVAEREIDASLIAATVGALPTSAPAPRAEGVQSFLQKRKPLKAQAWFGLIPQAGTTMDHDLAPHRPVAPHRGLHVDAGTARRGLAGGATRSLDMPSLLALAAALGWASGFRLYAVVFLGARG